MPSRAQSTVPLLCQVKTTSSTNRKIIYLRFATSFFPPSLRLTKLILSLEKEVVTIGNIYINPSVTDSRTHLWVVIYVFSLCSLSHPSVSPVSNVRATETCDVSTGRKVNGEHQSGLSVLVPFCVLCNDATDM